MATEIFNFPCVYCESTGMVLLGNESHLRVAGRNFSGALRDEDFHGIGKYLDGVMFVDVSR